MMRPVHAFALIVTLAPLGLAAGACTLIDLPDATDTSGLGVGGNGGGGGAEGADECTTADDCLDPGTDCIVRQCVDGECVYEPADDFVPVSNQAVGDCSQVVCNGEGGEKKVDIEDPFDDGKECTADLCEEGTPTHESSAGNPCSGGVCTSAGVCVECIGASDCADAPNNASECQNGKCVPPTCTDGQQNSDETDVDCGGPCAPCEDGEGCLVGTDCESLVCDDATFTCSVPNCDDGVANGDESDQDCGGSTCNGCAADAACGAPGDCESLVCVGAICQAPTCGDGVANGLETDIDCGGEDCGPCPKGKACKLPSDCASHVCEGNICQAPSCSDGVKNGTEKGIDCGGPCVPCKTGDPMEIIEQPSQ
jgi:hypothetical protein